MDITGNVDLTVAGGKVTIVPGYCRNNDFHQVPNDTSHGSDRGLMPLAPTGGNTIHLNDTMNAAGIALNKLINATSPRSRYRGHKVS